MYSSEPEMWLVGATVHMRDRGYIRNLYFLLDFAVNLIFLEKNCCGLVAKLCLTLCHLMDCSLPGSSVHWFSQARIQEQVAISFSRGSS